MRVFDESYYKPHEAALGCYTAARPGLPLTCPPISQVQAVGQALHVRRQRGQRHPRLRQGDKVKLPPRHPRHHPRGRLQPKATLGIRRMLRSVPLFWSKNARSNK